MWSDTISKTAGVRAHQVIQHLAGTGAGPIQAVRTARAMSAREGDRGTVAAGVRMAAASAASVYLSQFDLTAEVFGTEVPLGAGRSDLVWRVADGGILVDELKTGRVDPACPDLLVQLTGYVTAGLDRWGDKFLGVRVLPLSANRGALFVPPRLPVTTGPLPVELRRRAT